MSENKVKLGQFFTKKDCWLKPQVIDFINKCNRSIVYDPFAGNGDLIKAVSGLGFKDSFCLDIDPSLGHKINDSLITIPHIDDSIIITNPPYLAKQSATRKKLNMSRYFDSSDYDDLYLIALERILEAQRCAVAIIPESFINSSFKDKIKLHSITVLEENPFEDTENPVCVACFDSNTHKSFEQIMVYKNDKQVCSLAHLFSVNPVGNAPCVDSIKFNAKSGWLGLHAIDGTNAKDRIRFDYKENFNYDWENNIKVSSRHYSLIDIDIPVDKRKAFIEECNKALSTLRVCSYDLLFTPFKGNNKEGIRRRRLDFTLARAIMEKVYARI